MSTLPTVVPWGDDEKNKTFLVQFVRKLVDLEKHYQPFFPLMCVKGGSGAEI